MQVRYLKKYLFNISIVLEKKKCILYNGDFNPTINTIDNYSIKDCTYSNSKKAKLIKSSNGIWMLIDKTIKLEDNLELFLHNTYIKVTENK